MYGDSSYGNMRFEYAHFNSMDFGSYGLGASVSPMGSQLMNTNTAINWGTQHLEIALGTQMNFQQAGHLAQLGKIEREELIRLAKINRVSLSLHAPHFCAAGGQGNAVSETGRIKAVQEFSDTLKFADQIGTNMKVQHIPIVIHSTEGIPGNPMPKDVLYVVDKEDGRILPIEKKEVAYSEDYLKKYGLKKGPDYDTTGEKGIFMLYPEGRLKIQNKNMVENLEYQESSIEYNKRIHKQQLDISMREYQAAPTDEKEKMKEKLKHDMALYNAAVEQGERTRAEMEHLKGRYIDKETGELNILARTDDFAKEKSMKTFVELGMQSYNLPTKPMIAIEQFSPELALGDPRKTADLVSGVRKALADKLVKERGLSRERAQNEAKEIIGMNLDIGHLNLWKRYGKDREIMEELDKIYPFIKYVHITDNFGDYDAHLPVGWGNAPIKEVIDQLRKKGWKGRAVLETFGSTQYGGQGFGVPASLYEFGTQLIPGGPSFGGSERNYFEAGYAFTTGPILPDVNFQMYGVGFSNLPYATGGQPLGSGKPGEKFSGAPIS